MQNPSILGARVESLFFFRPGESVLAYLSVGEGRTTCFRIQRVDDRMECVPVQTGEPAEPEAKPEDGAE